MASDDAPAGAGTIRVFIVDDHELVRRGLVDLLGHAKDMVVVGEAASADQALRRIPAVVPDVALLDARLPDGSGIEVCRTIRSNHPGVRCLILTSYDDDEALFASVMAGASGYLLKDIVGASLVQDIRFVAQGRSLIDPALTARLMEQLLRPPPDDPMVAGLTRREQDVLARIAEGGTNRQIGEQLGLTEKTVKNYVTAILMKLGMQRRTQAAVFGSKVRPPSKPSS
jgi:two-component system response regulator DevR